MPRLTDMSTFSRTQEYITTDDGLVKMLKKGIRNLVGALLHSIVWN